MAIQNEAHNKKTELSLGFILVLAMALPMLILYASGALAPFMLQEGEIDRELLGGFTLATFGVAAILSLPAGRWVKKLGIRWASITLFLFTGGAFAALVLANHPWLMILAIAVCGIAQALANPMTNQAIATQVIPTHKSFMVGLKQSGVQLSALVAGTILPWIAAQWGWRVALGAIVPVCLFMAILAAIRDWQPKVTVPQIKSRKTAQLNTISMLMLMQGCVGIVLAAFITQVPMFASQLGMPLSQAAFLVTLFGLMGWVSRLVLTPLASRFKQESDLLALLFVFAFLALLATFNASAQNLWLVYVGVIGIGCTLVATNALAMSMILHHDCFGEIPTASGRVSFVFFGGLALGSLLFQWVVAYFGSTWAGVVFMLILLSFSFLAVLRLRWSLSQMM
ncbi:CynX/NimT family MFS transporter [Xenorhabdus miraniensis]|uniref:Putative ABC transporter n=1 Tax=Xenorhabdus miraniensis TaxID=351674 RepID=A0A2D0JW43_9GAMM|nr:MFS transporter [Xenorhabdus miraniensis]PHM50602.1 putative ABC transporter [Xenorhabdus miraniensis]